jgi:hypothetical protein
MCNTSVICTPTTVAKSCYMLLPAPLLFTHNNTTFVLYTLVTINPALLPTLCLEHGSVFTPIRTLLLAISSFAFCAQSP